jgi:hypothetical protein
MVASVVAQKLYRGALTPGTATPTFRAVSVASQINNVTTANAVIPASAQPGDLLALIVQVNAAVTAPVAPAGWTQIGFGSAIGTAAIVFGRVCQAGDPGSTTSNASWTTSANGQAHIVAYPGGDAVDGISAMVVTVANTQGSATQTDAAVTAASTVAGGAGYTQYTSWYVNAQKTITTAPAGMTNRLTLSSTLNNGSLVSYDVASGAGNQALTWSTTVTGNIVDIRFFVGIGISTIYTVPAATTTSVTNIVLTNTNTSVSWALVSLGGTSLLYYQYLAPVGTQGSVVPIDMKQVLLTGEVIAAGGTTGVNAHISGAEMT